MKASLANNDYLDFSDEQMRQVWADNISEWRETFTKDELIAGLALLTEYSRAYQKDWADSWE